MANTCKLYKTVLCICWIKPESDDKSVLADKLPDIDYTFSEEWRLSSATKMLFLYDVCAVGIVGGG